jgi:hypothetical protein
MKAVASFGQGAKRLSETFSPRRRKDSEQSGESPGSKEGRARKTRSNESEASAGGTCNGFLMKEEPETLDCLEANIAPYTLPEQALRYRPPPELIVFTFKNGDRERKIHCNTQLEAAELESLKQLQQEAAKSDAIFYPTVTSFATRYLSRTHGDVPKALKMLRDTQQWREEYFKQFRNGRINDQDLLEDFSHGIVYFCGRDKDLRPLLVLRPYRTPQKWYKEKALHRMINLLVFCMEYFMRYMIVPGQVENLSLLVDMKGMGLSQIPISALVEINKVMSNHYQGRVFAFYIMNMHWMLEAIAGAAKALLTDRQKQKLRFIEKVSELYKDMSPWQTELDLSGKREAITQFFPFPIEAGPYEIGGTTPDRDALKCVHKVLTRRGAQGSLWDPSLTRERNTRISWSKDEEATEILKKCGIADEKLDSHDSKQDKDSAPAPESLALPPTTSSGDVANKEKAPEIVTPSTAVAESLSTNSIISPLTTKPMCNDNDFGSQLTVLETPISKDDDLVMETSSTIGFCRGGFFGSCMPCSQCKN